MSKIQFRETKFKPETLARIRQMQAIVKEYADDGLKLTARQLYYQLVSRDIVANTTQAYKALTNLLTDARYAGLIDWDIIEDRVRRPYTPSEWARVDDLVESAVKSYRLPRWETQPAYAELWVEKEALAGVLQPMASKYHVTLSVNKGYSSSSAMFEASRRFIEGGSDGYKQSFLFYLGDHDPSGEDMVRDIEDRLVEFGVDSLTVIKLALTMDQVEFFKPPPNPAKTTDSRYETYAAKHGTESWEVDALPPKELQRIIQVALDEVVDVKKLSEVLELESKGREALRKAWRKSPDSKRL